MNLLNIILGVLLIILGVYIVKFHEELQKKGGLSFKLRTSGLGLIIIGIALIIREFGII
ncbi:MAG: hypothetical protein L3J25_09860 [Flavobacteriaceae bacterium]|nr:hypothetical protein [Flavobacteriaceae bacterium]